jgi:hypothetical protein
MDILKIAKNMHKIYCKYYKKVTGNSYWTKGNFNLLDDKSKEMEIEIVKAMIKELEKQNNNRSRCSICKKKEITICGECIKDTLTEFGKFVNKD